MIAFGRVWSHVAVNNQNLTLNVKLEFISKLAVRPRNSYSDNSCLYNGNDNGTIT